MAKQQVGNSLNIIGLNIITLWTKQIVKQFQCLPPTKTRWRRSITYNWCLQVHTTIVEWMSGVNTCTTTIDNFKSYSRNLPCSLSTGLKFTLSDRHVYKHARTHIRTFLGLLKCTWRHMLAHYSGTWRFKLSSENKCKHTNNTTMKQNAIRLRSWNKWFRFCAKYDYRT